MVNTLQIHLLSVHIFIVLKYQVIDSFFYFTLFIFSLEIRWNTDGAFLGVIIDGPISTEGEPIGPPLVFKTFLAMPYLSKKPPYEERKFSGSIKAGHSIDVLGQVMDAYAHHVLDDSNGSVLLTDLQGWFPQFFPSLHNTVSDIYFQELSGLKNLWYSLILKLTRAFHNLTFVDFN